MGRYAKPQLRPLGEIAIIDQETIDLIAAEIPATAWGNIEGTLALQFDLDSALSGKETANSNIQSHVTSAHLQFSGLTKITVAPTPPSDPQEGDLWIDTST